MAMPRDHVARGIVMSSGQDAEHSPKSPARRRADLYGRGMWLIEMWHGFALVLVVAWGIAALAGLSCVAMAGIDGADDEDPTYAAPI